MSELQNFHVVNIEKTLMWNKRRLTVDFKKLNIAACESKCSSSSLSSKLE